jgi:hypothetical protein
MFIEAGGSARRTPAGCYVGHPPTLIRFDPAHCTPLGCGSRTCYVSINIAPLPRRLPSFPFGKDGNDSLIL